jgi:hypothetical protein
MHPMFIKLFIETDADDLCAEEEARRNAARRARRRDRRAMVVRTISRDRTHLRLTRGRP